MNYHTVISKASRAALCVLVCLCLGAGSLPSAGASSLSSATVTRTADDNAPGSLRSAITQAASSGGTVDFQIPATDPGYNSATNTFTITLALGELDVPGSLSIVGPNMPSGAVVVSGGTGTNASRVFNIGNGMVSFSNLTIQNGNAPSNFDPFHNSTGTLGGGILNSATLTMTNCTVSQNEAFAGVGGGIANSGTLLLTGCTITGNSVDGTSGGLSYGGGLANFSTGIATLNNCVLSRNLTVLKPTISSSAGGGGAANFGTLNLNNCLIASNTCSIAGGGIDNGGTLNLNACIVSNNVGAGAFTTLGKGGGVNNRSEGTAQITNCLVINNGSYLAGGMNNDGLLTLINSTFAGNRAASRGGGLRSGPATLTNDIFYFDFSGAPGSALVSEISTDVGVALPTVTFSDVQGGYSGTSNINIDPQFVRNPDPNANPVDPGDEHLKLFSPAIHAGTNGPLVPTTDIEGSPRPTPPATPSMGAYEVPITNGFSVQGGFTITGTQNQDTGAQVLAKFLPGTIDPSGFTATVDFGDGTAPMTGTIAPDPAAAGVYQVTGGHTYTSPGAFPISVTVSGPNSTPTATGISTAAIQPILSSLTFPSPVPGGTVLTATVTLSGPALNDTVVGLSSSDSAVVRLHRSVLVPMGSSSATFAINTFRSHVTKTVTITAVLDQTSLTQNLTITGR